MAIKKQEISPFIMPQATGIAIICDRINAHVKIAVVADRNAGRRGGDIVEFELIGDSA